MRTYPEKKLLWLYEQMLKIRFCEESFVDPILRGTVKCPVHLCTGQEAIAAGVCSALGRKDLIFGNHRSHGHYLAKGGNLKSLVAEVYCRQEGCAKGRGGSMHLRDASRGILGSAPIVAGTISLAVGAALALKIRGQKNIVVSFFGDGAAGEGVLYESLNFAALKKLPVIFVCENNFYSTHMPLRECRASGNIARTAATFSLKSWRSDGNDVLNVVEKMETAAGLCRAGRGPVFLEFITYRFRGHVGPDDNVQGQHTDIRPQAEINRWLKKDPVKKFREYLLKNKLFSRSRLDSLEKNISAEVDKAHRHACAGCFPAAGDLNKYLYE